MTHEQILEELKNLNDYAATIAKDIEKDKSDKPLTLFIACGEPKEIYARAIGSDASLHAIWESLGEQLEMREPSRGVN